ncbi:hypothetical protein E8L99_23425 [Phreatobacter aquaticus]|uniref:Uncharacterized protein n=1 Tax=Phreatobacter aquaticus TaxID=2570229 RepID=A0A4D7QSW8_9HYPH|nr:hypothetical protein [Phreatobacter aquaticus]QCK88499.1 hypothetical protein E8L99_23425 [Phreatobacter aquaticus]
MNQDSTGPAKGRRMSGRLKLILAVPVAAAGYFIGTSLFAHPALGDGTRWLIGAATAGILLLGLFGRIQGNGDADGPVDGGGGDGGGDGGGGGGD